MATAALQSEPATVPSIDSLRVARPQKHTENYNPYLAARREWDERYGSLISRERNWRRMAVLCGLTTLVAIGGIVRLSVRHTWFPSWWPSTLWAAR